MPATTKVTILQRLAGALEDGADEPDAADLGTAFGLDCSLAALEHEGRSDDARNAAESCWPNMKRSPN